MIKFIRKDQNLKVLIELHNISDSKMSYSSLVRQLFNYVKTGFLEEMTPSMAPANEDWSSFPGGENVVVLTDDTVERFIRSKKAAIIMFSTAWCGHCKSAKPEYAQAAQYLAKEAPDVGLGSVDCQKNRRTYEKYQITGYPTFLYFRNGNLMGEYMQGRRASDFVQFMRKKPTTKEEL